MCRAWSQLLHPVLQRLGQMVPVDVIAGGQVGDRPRDLQDAIEAARGEGELRGRSLEQPAPVAAEGCVTPQQPALEVGVDAGAGAGEAGRLAGPRRHNTSPHLSRAFCGGAFRERRDGHGRDIDDEIESIAQWSGESPAITFDLLRCAAAGARDIAPVATGTLLRCLFAMSSFDRSDI